MTAGRMLHGRRVLLAGAVLATIAPRRAAGQESAVLRLVQPWELRAILPGPDGTAITRMGYAETLVAADPNGRIVPSLASRWSADETGTTWRFAIREEAIFHDGTPVTAANVAASFERLLPDSLYASRAGIRSVSAEGGTLVLGLAAPFGPLLAHLTDPSCAVMAPAAFDAQGRVSRPISAGPFRLVSSDAPRGVVLARHTQHWAPPSPFAELRFDTVVNGETRANIAVAGDTGLVFNIPTPAIQRLSGARGMAVDRSIIPRTHILMPNAALPHFATPELRRALSLAIDRAAIASGIMRNPALAATQYVPPPLSAWHDAALAPLRHDPAEANRILDAAGWQRGTDGVRIRSGVRYAGLVRTFANRPELPIIATALRQQFRAIGFDLTIRVGEWPAIFEGQRDGTLQLGLSSRNLAIVPDPVSTIATDFTTDASSPGAVGQTNWRHPGLRQHVAAYTASVDEPARARLRRAIVGVLQNELPVIPVVWYDQIVAVSNRFAGFVNDPFEQRLHLDRIEVRPG
jgi:peptide/nickel transport system substrate-binding protein